MQYCPKCLNESLSLRPRGVIHVAVNGKMMDAGKLLFHLEKDPEETKAEIHKKLEEFFAWYSGFNNKAPISQISLLTSDFFCAQGCPMSVRQSYSIVDLLIPFVEIKEMARELGEKYQLDVEILREYEAGNF